MSAESTSTIERPAGHSERLQSGIRNILLHVQDDRSLSQRVEIALALARTCGAHLQCVHITPIEAYVAFEGFGGVFIMNEVMKALDEEEARIRAKVEEKLGSEDVSWDYTQVTGSIATQIVRHGALNDLVVTGREPHDSNVLRSNAGLLGEILDRSRTPLFVPASNGSPVDVLGNALIAWDGSYEAANAVRGAIGLLKLATDVRVIEIAEEAKQPDFPNIRLLEFLSRHGVHAELTLETAEDSSGEAVAAMLVAHGKKSNADYVVMGGYNHSRIGEYFFGGVTRTLLDRCELPLVIAH